MSDVGWIIIETTMFGLLVAALVHAWCHMYEARRLAEDWRDYALQCEIPEDLGPGKCPASPPWKVDDEQ